MIGLAGADTINGDDAIQGGSDGDTIHGDEGDDLVHGGTGDDTLYGDDGLDTFYGGDGADEFVFEVDSAFNDIDVIQDFSTGDGDAIDIADFLVGYSPTTSAISDFVSFVNDSADSKMYVDRDGTAGTYSSAQIAVVTGNVDFDADDLLIGGHLIAA